ncbi:MAG: hypothetical protein K2N87_19140 [Eubacterium sp.]|nr:hypothetical protein [Eubacterium sp.]
MIDKISGNGNYEFPGGKKRKNPAVRAYENTPGAGGEARKGAAGAAKKQDALGHGKQDPGVVLDLSKHAGRQRAASVSRQKKESSLSGALRKLLTPVIQWLKAFWGPGRSEQEALEGGQAGIEQPAMDPSQSDAQAADSEGIAAPEQMQAGESEELELSDAALPGESEELSSAALLGESEELSGAALLEESMELSALGLSEEGLSLAKLDPAEEAKKKEALAKQVLKSGDLRQVERFLTQNGTKRLAHNSDLLTYYDRRGKFVEMDETEKHRVLYGDKNVLKL